MIISRSIKCEAQVIECTEEAVYNSMFMAKTVKGYHGTVTAIPLDIVVDVLKKYNR